MVKSVITKVNALSLRKYDATSWQRGGCNIKKDEERIGRRKF